MKFPAQEVILGALLTFGAFAMGMTLSSAGAPAAHEAPHQGEAFKLGEFLTAIATAVLVVVTYYLYKATKTLADATEALAASAEEDSHNRKVQATADAWWKLRAKLELPDLTDVAQDKGKVDAAGKAVVDQLRELEGFCQIVNSGVFDRDTFSKMSRKWFIRQIQKMRPYIELQQTWNPDAYIEMSNLDAKLRTPPSSNQSK